MRGDFAKTLGLTYEIRNIADIAGKLKEAGVEISWENIGDPVAKGEIIPEWIRDVVKSTLDNNLTYGYSPTKGVDSARNYLVKINNERGGAQITKDDIIFFNGLGDAVARMYSCLLPEWRVLLPEPTYSTHYMAEYAHSSSPTPTYKLDPANGWRPDIADIERQVKENKSIVGIMVVNPDNPTGYVYPEDSFREIVRIAKENDLFVICDELYHRINFSGKKTPLLADVIGDVPGIGMQSLSKEVPWPGGRCGWIQVYNSGKDAAFDKFIGAIYQQKMSEVCSATIPQMALPLLLEHPEYDAYLEKRVKHYAKLADIAYDRLKKSPYIHVNKTEGAFYMTVVFKDGVLNNEQTLPIAQENVKKFVEEKLVGNTQFDKRFVYYMLASTGICTVPLTSFFSSYQGFRMTLLEKDEAKFTKVIEKLSEGIEAYIKSK